MRKKNILYFIMVLAISVALATTHNAYSQDYKQIEAKALGDHSCDSTEWHFVITQISDASLAPSSISVSWENGSSADIALSKFTGGTAHYSTGSNLDSPVTGASAMIYSSWNGQFNLSHGPCPTPTPTKTEVPTDTPEIPTNTPTSTETNTPTMTLTATATATSTGTVTATFTPTNTLTPTSTSTGTITATSKPTNTPKVTETPKKTETPKNPTLTVVPNTPTATKELPLPGGTDPRGPSIVAFLVGISLILGTIGFILVRRRKTI